MPLQLMNMSSVVRGQSEEVLEAAREALRPWMIGSAVLNDPDATIVGLHLKPLPGSVVEIRRLYKALVHAFHARLQGIKGAVLIAADDTEPVDAMCSIYVRLPSQLG